MYEKNDYDEFIRLIIEGNEGDYITAIKQLQEFMEYVKNNEFYVDDLDEIIEVLHNNDMDKIERFKIIHSIFTDCQSSPFATIEELEDAIQEIYLEKGKCPDCGNDLSTSTWYEGRGDCRGFDSSEVMNERYCECGWTEED